MGMYLLNCLSEYIYIYNYSYCTELSETPVEMVRMDFLHKSEPKKKEIKKEDTAYLLKIG